MNGTQPQVFGKYLLIRRIAVGGMAEIFLAKVQGAQGFQRDVVIKRILPTYSEDEAFVTMFIDEARIAARLHHPNIVQIYDFDRCDDFYYIAMEYVNGRDLRKVLDRGIKSGKRITPVRTAQILADIAAGLKHAHEATSDDGQPLNIVHRDVSPHNIMLAFSGEAKILDFGIAKAAARSTRTRAGTVKGKCSYMSPEQARGRPLDGRSDLFALCAIGWEMLTARKLFQGESDFEILNHVMSQEVPAPSSLNREVPPELDAILLRGLERDLDRRYPDMATLERELRNFIFRNARGLDEVAVGPYLQDLFAEELDRGTSTQVPLTPSPQATRTPEPGRATRTPEPAPEPVAPPPAAVPEPTDGPPSQPTSAPVSDRAAGSSEIHRSNTLPLDEQEIAAYLQQNARKRPAPPPAEARPAPVEAGDRGTGVRGRSRAVLWGLLAALLAGGLGWWWVARDRGPGEAPGTPGSPAVAPAVVGASADAGAPPPPEPPRTADREPAPPPGPEPASPRNAPVPEVPGVSEIAIRGLPPKASVQIDGKPVTVDAQGAVRGEWKSGALAVIEVTAAGFAPWRQEVPLVAPRTEVTARMEKAAPARVRTETVEKKAPPPPAARATGRVSINAKPWADVYWKGRKIGTTPIRHFEVPVGRQVFVLRNQTASMELVIDVEENAEVSRLVELR